MCGCKGGGGRGCRAPDWGLGHDVRSLLRRCNTVMLSLLFTSKLQGRSKRWQQEAPLWCKLALGVTDMRLSPSARPFLCLQNVFDDKSTWIITYAVHHSQHQSLTMPIKQWQALYRGIGFNTWWVWHLPRLLGAQHCWVLAEPPTPSSSRSAAPLRLLQRLSASALLLYDVATPGPAHSGLQWQAPVHLSQTNIPAADR